MKNVFSKFVQTLLLDTLGMHARLLATPTVGAARKALGAAHARPEWFATMSEQIIEIDNFMFQNLFCVIFLAHPRF